MLSEIITECLAQAFDKEQLRELVVARGLKRNPAFQGSDLIWKINHRLRKKMVSKGDLTALIKECLVFLNLREIEPVI